MATEERELAQAFQSFQELQAKFVNGSSQHKAVSLVLSLGLTVPADVRLSVNDGTKGHGGNRLHSIRPDRMILSGNAAATNDDQEGQDGHAHTRGAGQDAQQHSNIRADWQSVSYLA